MAQDAPIVGTPLSDGVTVKPMAFIEPQATPLPAQEDAPIRLDPIEVTGKLGADGEPDVSSLQQQTPLRIRSLKRPVRASY